MLLAACAVLFVTAPAGAYWSGAGAGTGSGAVADLPPAAQPTAAVSGQSVTVQWAQSSFEGSPLGTYPAGGYVLTRYAQGSSTAVAPAAGCAGAISGPAATLECTETGVPVGIWQYTVLPVLGSFTGTEGPRSVSVSVRPPAPTVTAVTAQNPASGEATGSIAVDWGAVADATGYNVYRRTAAGSYDYSAPVNGATPLTGTTLTDAGPGLASDTTYSYVVRTVAGTPATESADSNELSAATISRPAAPTGVGATAVVAGAIDVSWTSVAGATGYNVYRRTAAGSYDFSSPRNGATPLSGTTYRDAATTNATTYHYTVRAVVIGAGSTQVESLDGTESAAVTSDATAPAAPSATSVTSGGNVTSATMCSIAAGTRYVNNAGKSAVGVSATVAAPEPGASVVFLATTPNSAAVTATVAAAATTTTTLDLSSLLDGTITLTARSRDAAGNLSGTVGPTNVVIKDTVVPPLTASYSAGLLGASPKITGSSQCGATVRAVKTSGGNEGKVFSTQITSSTSNSYSLTVEGPLLGLGSVSYSVTSTDLAGNTSAVVATGG